MYCQSQGHFCGSVRAVVSEARVFVGEEDCVVRDLRMLLGSFVEGIIRPIVVPQSVKGNLLAQQQAVSSSLLLPPLSQ
jgi:hypothetical protein